MNELIILFAPVAALAIAAPWIARHDRGRIILSAVCVVIAVADSAVLTWNSRIDRMEIILLVFVCATPWSVLAAYFWSRNH